MLKTKSLKCLSTLVLERNKKWNNTGTNGQNVVPPDFSYGTKNPHPLTTDFSSPTDLEDAYHERLAIAQYDGGQSMTQAQRIAYQDAFVSVLVTLPYVDNCYGEDWMEQRIKAAIEWLETKGINRPQ
jgi:hypothetical protein